MAIVTGVLESFENPNRFGKVSIKVNGAFYSTNPAWWKGGNPNVGDNVQFDDGGAKYIKNFKVVGAIAGAAPSSSSSSVASVSSTPTGKVFPIPALAPERAINRQNALTNATAVFLKSFPADEHVDMSTAANEIITLASELEAYTTGDLDRMEAEAAVAAEAGLYEAMGK